MSQKRCWTCKDRKIRCDLGFPSCLNCKNSKRNCPGYGLRLSWPRTNNPKRFVMGKSPANIPGLRRLVELHLINATFWDIEMYYHLSMPKQFAKPVIPVHLLWNPSKLRGGEMDLLQYFESVVSSTLTTFSDMPLGSLLISIAFSSDAPSNVAVLRSLLALASLYRHGYQMQAAQLKVAALQSLRASTESVDQDMSVVEAVKHVATGMLLCSFEIQQQWDASNHWVCYVACAIRLVNTISILRFNEHPMGTILLEWVYYHEVLARFGLRHWQRYEDGEQHIHGYSVQKPPLCSQRLFFSSLDSPKSPKLVHKLLTRFAQVCETVVPPSDPMSKTVDYKSRLRILELNIESTSVTMLAEPADPETMTAHAMRVIELYQIASLVYLNRASGDIFGQSAKMEKLVERGFRIFLELEYCERTLPLLILGIEARTNERRQSVLDLVSRSEKFSAKRTLQCLREMLQALWVQEDLRVKGDKKIEYMEMMSIVVSSSEALPHFA